MVQEHRLRVMKVMLVRETGRSRIDLQIDCAAQVNTH
jgi:hypothetical protein